MFLAWLGVRFDARRMAWDMVLELFSMGASRVHEFQARTNILEWAVHQDKGIWGISSSRPVRLSD